MVTINEMRKYRKWNTPQALSEANEKIAELSKRESIERGLYAEWMAVYRYKRKNTQLYRELFSNLALDKKLLIKKILDTVEKHEEKILISKRLIEGLTDFVDAPNREPKSPLTMPLADFQNLCSKVVYAAGEYDPWYPHRGLDFIWIECEKDHIKAEALDRRLFAKATIPASNSCSSGRFALHKKDVYFINKLTGNEITIAFLEKSIHISIDGKTVSDIPRPSFHMDRPRTYDRIETPAYTFLKGSRKNFLNLLRKFKGKTHKITVVMKRNSSYVMRPARLYATDRKTDVKIERIANGLNWDGDDLKVAMNNKTFYDVVIHAPESELTIAFWDPENISIIKSKNKEYEVHMAGYSPAEDR